jgi:hypothetical protein
VKGDSAVLLLTVLAIALVIAALLLHGQAADFLSPTR